MNEQQDRVPAGVLVPGDTIQLRRGARPSQVTWIAVNVGKPIDLGVGDPIEHHHIRRRRDTHVTRVTQSLFSREAAA